VAGLFGSRVVKGGVEQSQTGPESDYLKLSPKRCCRGAGLDPAPGLHELGRLLVVLGLR
jgi:hypothetical protein